MIPSYFTKLLQELHDTNGSWLDLRKHIEAETKWTSDDTFKCIFLNENVRISIKFHWSLFLRVH